MEETNFLKYKILSFVNQIERNYNVRQLECGNRLSVRKEILHLYTINDFRKLDDMADAVNQIALFTGYNLQPNEFIVLECKYMSWDESGKMTTRKQEDE